jgi:hypothetical protein
MGFFSKKKKVVKNIDGPMWGYMVNNFKIDVDTLYKLMRVVDREGITEEKKPVTFLRIFKLNDAEKKGVEVTGWETLDQNPDLILFEGYLGQGNEVHLERRNA